MVNYRGENGLSKRERIIFKTKMRLKWRCKRGLLFQSKVGEPMGPSCKGCETLAERGDNGKKMRKTYQR